MLSHLPGRGLPVAVVVVCGVLMIAGCGGSSKWSSTATKGPEQVKWLELHAGQPGNGPPVYVPTDPELPGSDLLRRRCRGQPQHPRGHADLAGAFFVAQKECAKLGLVRCRRGRAGAADLAAQVAQAVAILQMHACASGAELARSDEPRTPQRQRRGLRGDGRGANSSLVYLIPKAINIASPAVKQAAKACQFSI